MRAFVCLALMLALLPASFARAQNQNLPRATAPPTVYAVDWDILYSVDLASRQATAIGAAGSNGPQTIGDLSGLTTAPDGTLYAASDTIKALVRIDPDTGDATVVGDFGITEAQTGLPASAPLDFGMTYGCDGSLWLSSAPAQKLWRVNPGTGASTLVGALGHTISGLTMRDGKLYGAGARGDEGWYAIDPDSARATLVGTYGSAVSYAASFSPSTDAQGKLLGAINYVPPKAANDPIPDWSDLARIDPATGAVTILGPIRGPQSLRGIGIRGITFGAPSCGAVGSEPNSDNAFAVPALNPLTALLEWLALMLLARIALTRRP